MLSPGQFYLKVPKDREGNLRYRRYVLRRAQADVRFRRGLIEACRQDLLFCVNTFVWQFNPRKSGGLQVGPFVTWDFQDDAFRVMLDWVECHCHEDPEVHQG
jgi:hypothetical protein